MRDGPGGDDGCGGCVKPREDGRDFVNFLLKPIFFFSSSLHHLSSPCRSFHLAMDMGPLAITADTDMADMDTDINTDTDTNTDTVIRVIMTTAMVFLSFLPPPPCCFFSFSIFLVSLFVLAGGANPVLVLWLMVDDDDDEDDAGNLVLGDAVVLLFGERMD